MKHPSKNPGRSLRAIAMAMPLLLASSVSLAQESGWYGGLGYGRSSGDIETGRINGDLQAAGFGSTFLQTDDRDDAWKILGGYSFNRYIGLELSYFELGKYSFDTILEPADSLRGTARIKDGAAFDVVGTLPLHNRISAFARVGINHARIGQDVYYSIDPALPYTNRSDSGTNEKYGVGLQYAMNDNVSLRAEWERYRIDNSQFIDNRVDTVTMGLIFRFGRAAPPPPPPVAQAAPQPAPPPPPPPPPPPEPVRITLSATSLFDFDRAELKPAGRQELDGLMRDLQDVEYDSIRVTGHTDRIGTREYNVRLSERRAQAVRDYMVQSGIPAARITSRGVNSDEPVTTPAQCQGRTGQAFIACLEPDRRVEVEVSGMRDPD